MMESRYTEAGRDVVVCRDTPAGHIGLSTCYDVRFPEMYTCLAEGGAEVRRTLTLAWVVMGFGGRRGCSRGRRDRVGPVSCCVFRAHAWSLLEVRSLASNSKPRGPGSGLVLRAAVLRLSSTRAVLYSPKLLQSTWCLNDLGLPHPWMSCCWRAMGARVSRPFGIQKPCYVDRTGSPSLTCSLQ